MYHTVVEPRANHLVTVTHLQNRYIGFYSLSGFRGSICGRFRREDTHSKALDETDQSVSVLEGDSVVRVN